MDYPTKIENGAGEVLIFERVVPSPDGNCLEVRNEVQPGTGPPMHVHFKPEEDLTVVAGKMGYQILGEEPKFAALHRVCKASPQHGLFPVSNLSIYEE